MGINGADLKNESLLQIFAAAKSRKNREQRLKHAGKFGPRFKMGFPHKRNAENITSLEAPRISGISTMLQMMCFCSELTIDK